jgi:hypothetical protein
LCVGRRRIGPRTRDDAGTEHNRAAVTHGGDRGTELAWSARVAGVAHHVPHRAVERLNGPRQRYEPEDEYAR